MVILCASRLDGRRSAGIAADFLRHAAELEPEEGSDAPLKQSLEALIQYQDGSFANDRSVRRLFERVRANQADGHSGRGPTQAELRMIHAADIEVVSL